MTTPPSVPSEIQETEAEPTAVNSEDKAETADDKATESATTRVANPVRSWTAFVAATVLLVAVAASAFTAIKWHQSANQLAATRSELSAAQTDTQLREGARKAATDYADRVLNYSYRDLDGYFVRANQGVGAKIREMYANKEAVGVLREVMTKARTTSSGTIIGSDVTSVDGDKYTVLVFARQQVTNVQIPESATLPNNTRAVVARTDGGWIIEEFGPQEPLLPGSGAPR